MKEPRRITTISFDGDATLWDFQKVMRHALAITLDELRRRLPGRTADLTVGGMIKIRNAVAAELKGKTVNHEEIRFQAFRRTVESVGCTDDALAADLNTLYLKHRFEDIELFPDVIPALDALGPHFSLGLLSNGNGYPERCGLPNRFRFAVFSQDVGADKPHPAMFSTACSQASCTPAELLHVGDSLKTDIAGANAVGAISVWLNRNRSENPSDIQPAHEIQSLAALPAIAESYATADGAS